MGNNCLIMTAPLRKQYEEILNKYPDECTDDEISVDQACDDD